MKKGLLEESAGVMEREPYRSSEGFVNAQTDLPSYSL